jgi:hypothetical protein
MALDRKQSRVLEKIVNKELMLAEPAIEISRRKANEMIKSNNTRYWTIWTRRLNGSRYKPQFKNGPFPGGSKGAVYNYQAKGYWVGFEDVSGRWRTIVLRNVDKFKVGNQVYRVV